MKINHFLIATGALVLAACNGGAADKADPQAKTDSAASVSTEVAPKGKYASGDQLFVYAKSGLTLRDTPDPNGAKIATVANHTAVTVEDSEPFKHAHTVTEPCGLKIGGHWVKVKVDGKQGYLFDGYLLKFRPLVDEDLDTYWNSYSKVKTTTTEPPKNDVNYYGYSHTVWENGVDYESSGYEGGSNSHLILPKSMFTYEEAYLFAVADFLIGTDVECSCQPSPQRIECMSKDELSLTTMGYTQNGDIEIVDSYAD